MFHYKEQVQTLNRPNADYEVLNALQFLCSKIQKASIPRTSGTVADVVKKRLDTPEC